VLFLAVGGRVKALLVFEDPTRPEARSAVQGLHDLDVDVVLLSGDHRASVEAIARALDITHVKAELGTQERGAEVLRLRDAGGLVVVVGRAGLDDTSLGAADVSITLDAAGGPREGDLAVASDDLRDAVEGLRIAHRARRTVQLVLAGSAGVAVLIGVSAVLSVLPPLGAVLAAMALDAWALPSTARLVPPKRRASAAARSHGGASSAARTGA
jgi:P-type E1-E2 ATPase